MCACAVEVLINYLTSNCLLSYNEYRQRVMIGMYNKMTEDVAEAEKQHYTVDAYFPSDVCKLSDITALCRVIIYYVSCICIVLSQQYISCYTLYMNMQPEFLLRFSDKISLSY